MSFDPTVVAAAVDELAAAFRADGGDLMLVEANPRIDRIRLRLSLDGVRCLDCVLPPEMLYESITMTLARLIPGEFELVIDDPRRRQERLP